MTSRLLNYFTACRQVGNSTLLSEGIKNYDRPFYVISGTRSHANEIAKSSGNKNAIPLSIEELVPSKIVGTDYPICIDNFGLIKELENLMFDHKKAIVLSNKEKREDFENYKYRLEQIKRLWSKDTAKLSRQVWENSKLTDANSKLNIRINKSRKRIKPTLEELAKLSFWDRVFNYKKKVSAITDEYLF